LREQLEQRFLAIWQKLAEDYPDFLDARRRPRPAARR
jgi:hypothetical protein